MTGLEATGRSIDDGATGAAEIGATGAAGVEGATEVAGAAASGVTTRGAAASTRWGSAVRPHTTTGRSGALPAAWRRAVARLAPGVSDIA